MIIIKIIFIISFFASIYLLKESIKLKSKYSIFVCLVMILMLAYLIFISNQIY